MPTCTPIYGLEYAIGADEPCEVDETFCAFAASVEAELDRLDAIVDRTVDTIPLAKVRLTVPAVFGPTVTNTTFSIPFDTIDVDTANMVDLDADPTLITLPFFGIYSVGWQIQVAAVTSGDSISGELLVPRDTYLSDGSTPVYLNSAGSIRYFSPAGTMPIDTLTGLLNLNLNVLIGTFTVTSATLTVYWLRDLP